MSSRPSADENSDERFQERARGGLGSTRDIEEWCTTRMILDNPDFQGVSTPASEDQQVNNHTDRD